MAIQSQPSRISEPFAGSGTKNVIPATNSTPSASQAASWASGFPPECSQPISAGGCPVPRNDMNGVLNWLSQGFAFNQDGGVWEWSALADYDTQRVVRGSDGQLYWSVAQSGPGVAAGAQDPTADNGTYWTAVPTNNADVVHISGNETITGTKTLEQNTLEINSTSAQSKAFIGGTVGGGMRIAAQNLGVSDPGAKLDLNSDGNSALPGGLQLWLNDGVNASWLLQVSGNYNINTFTNNIISVNNKLVDVTRGSTIPSALVSTTILKDKNDELLTRVQRRIETNGNCTFWFSAYNKAKSGYESMQFGGGMLGPVVNGEINLGASGNRWANEYFQTNPNVSSDARLKTEPEAFPDAVLDAWGDVQFVQFQMLDSVAEKGADAARLHSGIIAQRIGEAFEAHGLDARRYGLFCHDEWDARPEERDEKGEVVTEAREAGDCYSIRYEEALCMEAAYQRRRADRAEARIAALEERLATIEAKLNA